VGLVNIQYEITNLFFEPATSAISLTLSPFTYFPTPFSVSGAPVGVAEKDPSPSSSSSEEDTEDKDNEEEKKKETGEKKKKKKKKKNKGDYSGEIEIPNLSEENEVEEIDVRESWQLAHVTLAVYDGTLLFVERMGSSSGNILLIQS